MVHARRSPENAHLRECAATCIERPRSPYLGKLGIIEEGALADVILVDGDPLTNLDLIADPGRHFTVIMKDGIIYKGAHSPLNRAQRTRAPRPSPPSQPFL